jgi:hypothetical protein
MSSDAHDFAFDDGDLQASVGPPAPPGPGPGPEPEPEPSTADGAEATAPTPPPMVVIQYRNRGLHLTLLPPLLILLAALTITAYKRHSRLRPPAPPGVLATSVPNPTPSRSILVEPSGAGAAVESITLRPLLPPVPAPPLEPVPMSAILTPPLDEPADDVPGEGPLADAAPGRPGEPGTSSGDGEGRVVAGGATKTPLAEPPEPPRPTVAEELPADSPELAFRVAMAPAEASAEAAAPTPGPAPNAEPKVTKDQVLADVRGEAAQKKADQKDLERDIMESKLREYLDVFQKLQEDRPKFHAELRQILRERGDSSEKIRLMCDRYGREALPEVKLEVSRRLRSSAAGLLLEAKIKYMRRCGVPEAGILDFLSHDLVKDINRPGGPRDAKEVRVFAARKLLAYPPAAPKPKATGSTSSISRVTRPGR